MVEGYDLHQVLAQYTLKERITLQPINANVFDGQIEDFVMFDLQDVVNI